MKLLLGAHKLQYLQVVCGTSVLSLAQAAGGGTGVTQIDRVVEAVEETLKGNTIQLLAKKALPRLDLPKARPLPWCATGRCRSLSCRRGCLKLLGNL